MNHYNVKLRCFIRLRKRGVEGSVFLFFFSCPRLTTMMMMMMTFPVFFY